MKVKGTQGRCVNELNLILVIAFGEGKRLPDSEVQPSRMQRIYC
jgi:hypothetical protein